MPVPVLSVPYTPQASTFLDLIDFDVSAGWTGADSFEINTLPPGFTFDEVMTLGGVASVNMGYAIYVRAGNADGLSDWEPLQWTVTGQVSKRTLYGLSLTWQLIHPSGSKANLDILRATSMGRQTTGGSGRMMINDVANDGSATTYDSSFIDEQIALSGASDAYFRATQPGWEILIDTASLP